MERIDGMDFVDIPQTHYVYSTLKQRGNDGFHVVPTSNTHDVFVGKTPHLSGKVSAMEKEMNC